VKKIVAERELLANDGRFEKPRITPDAVAVLQYTAHHGDAQRGDADPRQYRHQRQSGEDLRNLQVKEGDSILGILPLFHVFAMTTVMNYGIASGMEMILVPKFELIDTLS